MTLQQLEDRLNQVLNSVDNNRYSLTELNNKLFNKEEIYPQSSEPTEGKSTFNLGYLQRLETLVEFLESSVRDEWLEINRLYDNIEPRDSMVVSSNSANGVNTKDSIGVGIGYPNNFSTFRSSTI